VNWTVIHHDKTPHNFNTYLEKVGEFGDQLARSQHVLLEHEPFHTNSQFTVDLLVAEEYPISGLRLRVALHNMT